MDEFDADAYAADVAATGARYAVLTLTQGSRFLQTLKGMLEEPTAILL